MGRLLNQLQVTSCSLFATTYNMMTMSRCPPHAAPGGGRDAPRPPHSAKRRLSNAASTAALCCVLCPTPFVLLSTTRSSCIVRAPPLAVLSSTRPLALHHPPPPLVVLSTTPHPLHAPGYSPCCWNKGADIVQIVVVHSLVNTPSS
jgi:hypothetical protein